VFVLPSSPFVTVISPFFTVLIILITSPTATGATSISISATATIVTVLTVIATAITTATSVQTLQPSTAVCFCVALVVHLGVAPPFHVHGSSPRQYVCGVRASLC